MRDVPSCFAVRQSFRIAITTATSSGRPTYTCANGRTTNSRGTTTTTNTFRSYRGSFVTNWLNRDLWYSKGLRVFYTLGDATTNGNSSGTNGPRKTIPA